jgi:hypothetical protein
MINKHTFYIGLNDKDSKVQEVTTLDAFKIVTALVGDCTITEGRGVYTHADGTQVLESTLIVQVLDFDGGYNYKEVADALKVALNQESVAVIHEQINSELI